MFKTIIKITAIIFLSLVLCGFNRLAKAENKNFMLPKTFKINDNFLPPLDIKQEIPKNKTISTVNTVKKVAKPSPVVISTVKTKPKPAITRIQTKNNIPAVYKQPPSIVKTNPAIKSNNTVSLTNLIRNYEYSYADTLKSTIMALSSMGIAPSSYNTQRGQIIAKLRSGKEIFILLVPFKENFTCVRITPTDGNYNFSLTLINEIFSNIKTNLPANKN